MQIFQEEVDFQYTCNAALTAQWLLGNRSPYWPHSLGPDQIRDMWRRRWSNFSLFICCQKIIYDANSPELVYQMTWVTLIGQRLLVYSKCNLANIIWHYNWELAKRETLFFNEWSAVINNSIQLNFEIDLGLRWVIFSFGFSGPMSINRQSKTTMLVFNLQFSMESKLNTIETNRIEIILLKCIFQLSERNRAYEPHFDFVCTLTIEQVGRNNAVCNC